MYRQTVPEYLQYDLWVDGGCIKKNPSTIGGTWAWTLVDRADRRVECDSGVVTPADIWMKTVSNNVMELYAAVMGLEAMQKGWCGLFYTDSRVTLLRLTCSHRFRGIPDDLKQRCLKLRANKLWTPMLCGGHPTKADLAVGYNKKGRPVSPHNCWCDEECKRKGLEFLTKGGSQ